MNETTLREALALAQELIDMMDWTGTGTSGEGQSERREYEARLAALARADAPDDTLDAAWKEAEAALPEGWDFGITKTEDGRYRASSAPLWAARGAHAEADTAIAALRALAARLQGEQE